MKLKSEYEKIILDICEKHGVSLVRFMGPQREQNIVKARIECSKTLRDHGLSFPRIGELMNRHHSTIIHHLKPKKPA